MTTQARAQMPSLARAYGRWSARLNDRLPPAVQQLLRLAYFSGAAELVTALNEYSFGGADAAGDPLQALDILDRAVEAQESFMSEFAVERVLATAKFARREG
ncbi:MAG: hypothetical protein KF903_13950 [Dokdonella sp.]|uniref:hypothetical protein n=1 Tax=Dokdonella sp. TaxID=2291710 RepID=UPI0025B8424D|nr:hypothetical protein [Dokdonella sp.]MBX3702090.1 hypothetical protein [Dokdonella sp.]